MNRMFGYPEFDPQGKCVLTTTDGEFKEMLMNITFYDLKEGEVREFWLENEEMAILLIEGGVHFQWANQKQNAERHSYIKEGPYCLHVCRESRVIIKAEKSSEILIQTTRNEKYFDYHFYTPADCGDAVAGKGLYKDKAVRIVRTIFDYQNAPYSNMVLGEVISEQGGWTSYIPHHHPQPEVYYYRYERPEGFGGCFIGSSAYKVTDRSFAAIPGGLTHPQVSAPGYPMYYVWMIRHFDGNPWTDRIDDQRYTWLLADQSRK
jgi:5-deoxy-glucuronate isomerase